MVIDSNFLIVKENSFKNDLKLKLIGQTFFWGKVWRFFSEKRGIL